MDTLLTVLPSRVVGQKSPYPSEVRVCTAHHIPCGMEVKSDTEPVSLSVTTPFSGEDKKNFEC